MANPVPLPLVWSLAQWTCSRACSASDIESSSQVVIESQEGAGEAVLHPRFYRRGHKLPSSQIAESTLIGDSAMAQQLGQHGQRLVGEILVDEGVLPG